MLINFDSVSFGYNDTVILDRVNFTLSEGDRVGLIGGNGAGKTTLIRLMTGDFVADSGSVQIKNGVRIGYLEQNGGFDSDRTVYDEMRTIFKRELDAIENLRILGEKMADAEYGSQKYRELSAKFEQQQKFIDSRDAYNVDVKIKTVLGGMGFDGMYSQIISTMSGGEKTRLKLCRLLLEEPELLILDEPTNHLDIKTLFWLEEYLASFSGSIFVVSHDRYFLDKLVTQVYELDRTKLEVFKGNYTKYKVLKAERVAYQQKEYDKQQEEIAKMEDYVARNQVRATTAKSAQSRIKKLESMERIAPPLPPITPPRFSFTFEVSPYERVLEIQGLNLTAGEKQLITNGNLTVLRGEKIAVVGDNGTGKSTLIRRIVQSQGAKSYGDLDESVTLGRFVDLAYYDQENANLDPEQTVLSELWGRHHLCSQTEIRKLLARVKLDEGDVDKKVGLLSGGERAKLALAVFEAEHGNLLVLDEPTNHLDLQARESLEEALRAFKGTIVFVSHDRYFVQAIAHKIVEIENAKLIGYDGDYEYYREQKRKKSAEEAEKLQKFKQIQAEKKALDGKTEGYRSKAERAAEVKRKQQVLAAERRIEALETEEADLTDEISTVGVAGDYQLLKQKCDRLEEIRTELESLYELLM